MYCVKCGKDNTQGAAFCAGCGAALADVAQQAQAQQFAVQQPVFKEKPKGKKNVPAIALGVLSVLLAAALVLSLLGVFGGAAGGLSTASKSFSSPEDAIYYFAERLKEGDFKGALSACAIEEMASGFDYEYYAERLKNLTAIQISYLPPEYEQYVAVNRCKFEQQLLMQMTCFAVSFNLSEEYADLLEGVMMPLKGEFPDELLEQLDPGQMGNLEVVDIGKADKHDSEQNRDNQKKQAKMFGADDLQFRSVLYEYDGDYYMGGFTLIEYDGRWLIQNMSDPLSGISAYGTPEKIGSEKDFEDLME